jgi:hypothetical protein
MEAIQLIAFNFQTTNINFLSHLEFIYRKSQFGMEPFESGGVHAIKAIYWPMSNH